MYGKPLARWVALNKEQQLSVIMNPIKSCKVNVFWGILQRNRTSRMFCFTHTFPKKGSFPGSGHRERRSLRQVWLEAAQQGVWHRGSAAWHGFPSKGAGKPRGRFKPGMTSSGRPSRRGAERSDPFNFITHQRSRFIVAALE